MVAHVGLLCDWYKELKLSRSIQSEEHTLPHVQVSRAPTTRAEGASHVSHQVHGASPFVTAVPFPADLRTWAPCSLSHDDRPEHLSELLYTNFLGESWRNGNARWTDTQKVDFHHPLAVLL